MNWDKHGGELEDGCPMTDTFAERQVRDERAWAVTTQGPLIVAVMGRRGQVQREIARAR